MILLLSFYSICITIVGIILAKQLLLDKKSINNLQQLSKHYSDRIDQKDAEIKLLRIQNDDLEKECDDLSEIIEQKMFEDFGVIGNQNPFQDMLNQISTSIKNHIDKEKDTRVKEIGDRVLLWDWSFAEIVSKTDIDKEIYSKLPAIVIKTNCNIPIPCKIDNSTHILDICIRYDDGTEIYTKSEFIKRNDVYKK